MAQRASDADAGRLPRRGCLLAVAVAAVLAAAPGPAVGAVGYGPFSDPQPVHIEGYAGSAEEPFITPDGRYLLFNSSEEEADFTLQYATALGAQTFDYQGEILGEGVNEAGSLSGTPTLDDAGNLYFVSTRSYFQTLSTIYTGVFSAGTVTGVHLVEGVSGARVGLIDFDVGVSPDGSSLYVSVGEFSGGAAPSSADIIAYERVQGGGFAPAPGSAHELKAVNETGALVYGAAVSADGLELFYTAASPAEGVAPSVYRATRASTAGAFGSVERISAITGFAEAPSLSSDGTTLYYHEKAGSEVHVMDVTRARYTSSVEVTRVAPAKGPAAGGTTLRIHGRNLAGVTAVDVGDVPASDVDAVSASELTAVSPPATAGEARVSVTTAEGTSEATPRARFRYGPPTVTSVNPASGPLAGGTGVSIAGSGFATGKDNTTVLFGSSPAMSVECASLSSCVAISPPSGKAGPVPLRVEVVTSRSRASAFTYVAS